MLQWNVLFIQIENLNFLTAVERQKSKIEREKPEIRIVLAQAAFKANTDSYGLGVGIGQFQHIDNFYQFMRPFDAELASERFQKDKGLVTHNSFLQILAEGGIFALLFFVAFLVRIFKNIKSYEPSIVNNKQLWIFFGLIIFSISHVIFFNPIFWIGFGICNNNQLLRKQ